MKKALLIAGSLLLAVGTAEADQITKPHTFTAGTPAQAEQVNADFDTVYDQVNKVGAAITVDGDNQVGIGTATPAGELHVTKPHVLSAIAFTGSGPNDIHVSVSSYNGAGTTSYVVRVQNAGPSPDLIEFSSDGGATWSAPVGMDTYGLDGGNPVGNNVVVAFTDEDGHNYGDQWSWTVSQGFPDGLIVRNGKVTVKELAITGGAAVGQVLTADADGNATWQATAPDADNDSTNELQTISRVGDVVTLSHDGGWISVADNDSSATNELQTISRSGDTVTLSNNGGAFSVADNDSSITNEIQTLSLSGSTISLTGGGSVTIDSSPANELNSSVTMTGTTLIVSDPGGDKSLDLAEKLSIGDLNFVKDNWYSLYIGENSGNLDSGSGYYNVGLGRSTLASASTGHRNTAVGAEAMYSTTEGAYNTATGLVALRANTTGNYNTASGALALYVNSVGSNNVAIGYNADSNNLTGSNNTIVGFQAGRAGSQHSKSGNIFLGYQAGYSETGSDKLYIDNSNTTLPLIYGDFATDALTVNGTLSSTDNAAIGAPVQTARTLNVLGGVTADYAGYFETDDTTTATGVFGRADAATNQLVNYYHYGVYGEAAGARYNYGLNGSTSGTGANVNYGVNGTAYGTGATINYGVNGTASGASTNYGVRGYVYDTAATTNYGVYGYAGGGVTNYAGYFSGNVYATGTLTQNSDERLKENIRPVEDALAKVEAISGVYYNMKDNPGQTEVGVIAQDVEKVLPEAVRVGDIETGYLGVSYHMLIPVLIEAVKELKAENEALKLLVCQEHPEAEICK